jgi:acetyl esterase/lipase
MPARMTGRADSIGIVATGEPVQNDALQQEQRESMPSLRARMINAFLRLGTKRRWRPDLDIQRTRRLVARMDARLSRHGATTGTVESVDVGVPATWHGPAAAAERGTILYLHGGAWCLHLPGAYRRLANRLHALTGMRVLLLDYRLAPEYPFPAGVDDCYAAYRWLLDRGFASRPLAIAGDSAGGSLTLVTLMRARDASLPLPDCGVRISPSTDLTMSGPSVEYNERADPMFAHDALGLLPSLYCPGNERSHPWLSPLFGQWQGLPPLLFQAASTEMLLDDSVRAHDRAVSAGVDSRIRVWRDLPHVAPLFTFMPEADRALREIADFIVGRLRPRVAAGDMPHLQRNETEGEMPPFTAPEMRHVPSRSGT